jgi:NAD(P)-dependent dehydrogenase (short-subunit alcohol dehydrogenase family)
MKREIRPKLEGDIAFVTGGGSGIARAICQLFASEGAKVAVADLNPASAQETVDMIKADGGEAIAIQFDVSNWDEVHAAVDKCVKTFGSLSILINCAHYPCSLNFYETTPEVWDKVINVDLDGYFYCLKAAYPYLKAKGNAKVVQFTSTAALSGGINSTPAYAAAKGGIISLTRHCARIWVQDGIRVNTIAPNATDTRPGAHANTPEEVEKLSKDDLIMYNYIKTMPMGRMCSPLEMANAALFLASGQASYITGITLEVTGGKYIYGN